MNHKTNAKRQTGNFYIRGNSSDYLNNKHTQDYM